MKNLVVRDMAGRDSVVEDLHSRGEFCRERLGHGRLAGRPRRRGLRDCVGENCPNLSDHFKEE